MKINLIGMILNNAGRRCFDGAILDDNGKPLAAADALHFMILEYAKVVSGGTSDVVVASREVTASAAVGRLSEAKPDEIERVNAQLLATQLSLEDARTKRDELMAHIEHGKPLPEWAAKWVNAHGPNA